MRPLTPLLLLLGAGLCFMAGYTLGKKQPSPGSPSPRPATELVAQIEATAPDAQPAEIPAPVEVAEPEETAATAAPVQAPTTDPAQLAQRAQQRIITLKDNQQRAIKVELLEVKEHSIKVRRQSDFRIVEVPVKILSAEDQAFAAYLWAEKNPTPKDRTDTQMILDELFGGFD